MKDIVNELRDRSYASKAKDPLRERAADEMNARDHFAAAALTGLLSNSMAPEQAISQYVRIAAAYADAMLRERDRTKEKQASFSYTNHDAAPAAKATKCGGTSHDAAGTGNTTSPPVASTGPINRHAASQSPDAQCGGGEPLDDTRPDTKGEATGERGHHIPDSRTR
ncbi:MAG: hypothetical protein EBR82_55190, partial [Caulobacteraceae bacterium]|nr:hypothetical protein [Caulobacteraceae bacterium]